VDLIDSISMTGSRGKNEDALAFTPKMAVIIDGATGYNARKFSDYQSDPQWFSQTLSKCLVEFVPGSPTLFVALSRSLEVVKLLADDLGMKPTDYPRGSVVIARETKNSVEILSLGDCLAMVRLTSGDTAVIKDDTVTNLDNASIAAHRALATVEGLTPAAANDLALPIKAEQRKLANVPGGFWIAEPNGLGVYHAKFASFDTAHIESIALMTDGLSAYKDNLRDETYTYDNFMADLHTRGLNKIWYQIKTAYDLDPGWEKYPRFKHRDDATGMVLRCH